MRDCTEPVPVQTELIVMATLLRAPWLITALLAAGLMVAARAQTAPAPVAPVKEVSPVLDPAKAAASTAAVETPAAPKHDRVMSNAVAATLADGMPKYNPPPKAVEPTPEEPAADLREIDKPKNKIIRLQKVIVSEPKPPVFRDRDLEKKSGLTNRGLERHAGLQIGNAWGLNRPVALLMYEEQERLDNMSALNNDAKDAKNSGDSAAAAHILKENNRANYRPSDFGWNSDNPTKDAPGK